jgi:hypothetical protein
MTTQPKDRLFRSTAEKLGGHYHVRVFSGSHPEQSFACLGTLVMDEHDYASFTRKFGAQHHEDKL